MNFDLLPRRQRESVGFLATRVGRMVHAELTHSLEDCELTPNQFTVVSALEEFGAQSQADLAERVQANRGHLVGLLDDLERRDVVVRCSDVQDRRRNQVHLTPTGEKIAQRAAQAASAAEESVFSVLTGDERAQLQQAMTRVIAGAGDGQ